MKWVRIVTLDKEGRIHNIDEISTSSLYRKNGDLTSLFGSRIKNAIDNGHYVSIEKDQEE